MYVYGRVPLLFTLTYHNIVNQLYPQYKIKSLKFVKKKLVSKIYNTLYLSGLLHSVGCMRQVLEPGALGKPRGIR